MKIHRVMGHFSNFQISIISKLQWQMTRFLIWSASQKLTISRVLAPKKFTGIPNSRKVRAKMGRSLKRHIKFKLKLVSVIFINFKKNSKRYNSNLSSWKNIRHYALMLFEKVWDEYFPIYIYHVFMDWDFQKLLYLEDFDTILTLFYFSLNSYENYSLNI